METAVPLQFGKADSAGTVKKYVVPLVLFESLKLAPSPVLKSAAFV